MPFGGFVETGAAHRPRGASWSNLALSAFAVASGAALTVWVTLHLLGVWSAFRGAEEMDGYAALLHGAPAALWGMRAGLAAAFGAHVWSVTNLVLRARKARGKRSALTRYRSSTWAARAMPLSGALLFGFLVLHVGHMTVGVLHPSFAEGAAYHNLVSGLRHPLAVAVYAFAAFLLGMHLRHGVLAALSAFAATRVSSARRHRRVALGVALTVGVGFALVPLAVAMGVLR